MSGVGTTTNVYLLWDRPVFVSTVLDWCVGRFLWHAEVEVNNDHMSQRRHVAEGRRGVGCAPFRLFNFLSQRFLSAFVLVTVAVLHIPSLCHRLVVTRWLKIA